MVACLLNLIRAADYETVPGRATFDITYSVFTDKYTFKANMAEKEFFMIAFEKDYKNISGNFIVWSTIGD